MSAPSTKLAPKPAPKPSATRIVDAKFLAGAGPGSALPPPVNVELAFAGRSNVGKSSLINALVERKSLVRTSSTPGSTRQVNLFEAKAADGALFHLVDLPGYGFSKRSKHEKKSWEELIEGYLSERVTLTGVVLLVDVRRGLEPDDVELVEYIESLDHPSRRPLGLVVVGTKIDKIPRAQREPAVAALRKSLPPPAPGTKRDPAKPRRVLGFSAETGEGREALWSALRKLALGEAAGTPIAATAAAGGEPSPSADDAG